MNVLIRVASLVLVGLVIVGFAAGPARADSAKHYVCPPCGAPCDTRVFDKPGICPECGMALVEQGSLPPPREHKKVGILLFNGVEIIDYTGPWEMFGSADFEVYTIAADTRPRTTAMGMTVVPKYSFADAPLPDVLVVPGGGVKATCDDAATLEWLRKASAHSEHTLSVCNGSFILASAGLLDGLNATTTAHNIDRMRPLYPKVHVVDDQRVVDNGKIITAGGLSAGIDGALHVISVMLGPGTAQRVALNQEYNWQPDGGYVRAALADMQIPQVDMDSMGDFQLVSTAGDRDHWNLVIRGSSKLSQAELMDRIGREFESKGKWQNTGAARATGTAASAAASSPAPGAGSSSWHFTGRDGKPWSGELRIQPAGGDHQYVANLSVTRRS
jgi:putative intracellular protease/amidase